MAERKYEFNTSETDHLLIFSDGMLARLIGTFKDMGDSWLFYCVPVQSTVTYYDLEKTKNLDPRYNKVEDWYELKVPKHWVKPKNTHPFFGRWEIFSDWSLQNFLDPMSNDRKTYVELIATLQKERDALWKRVNSILRKQSQMADHLNRAEEDTIEHFGKILEKMNFLRPKDEKKEGGQ